ncbi:MAG: peptide deformylase [Myxococcota bacterium]|jgi:peptide deformylase
MLRQPARRGVEMGILKVARMGHPILREIASEVPREEIVSAGFQDFVDSMIATMREYDGAGLAAPQVHVSKRVVVMEVAGNVRYPDAPEVPLLVVINPRIHFLGDERIEGVEGCLSVPGLRGVVSRVADIELEALDREGNETRQRFTGFPAAVVQHECDHLDGVLYLDRVGDTKSLSFLQEFERYHAAPNPGGTAS